MASDRVCRHCGVNLAEASATHHALCPVPRVEADPDRAGVREIAMSDYVDVILERAKDIVVHTPLHLSAANEIRAALTDGIGLVLNWGLRDGYARALAHIPDSLELKALRDAIAEQAPR